jgi:tetratricopeptide (TPR) repeat protein
MAADAQRDDRRLGGFRGLLRDARNPKRLRANPLAAAICSAPTAQLCDAFLSALQVSLHRLTPRQRAIVARYDLGRETVEALCSALAVSRRQFFRDHRAALRLLADQMLPPRSHASGTPEAVVVHDAAQPPGSFPAPSQALANGLRNVGAYDEAIALLRPGCDRRNASPVRLASALDIAEIAAERGDTETAKTALIEAKTVASADPAAVHACLAAQLMLVDGHLVPSHREREERYEFAVSLLAADADPASGEERGPLLVRVLHALSLSHDHRGDWLAAREAARRAAGAVERFGLGETPFGLLARTNYAMRDARQFGNTDVALETLRSCLAVALRNGWIQVTGDVAVHFINLNLMRSRYVQALQWRRWIAGIDAARLSARTRNFLAVDSAHALTMLGHPDRALAVLQAEGDEGLAFSGAREYWRAEALHAAGDAERALRLGLRALDGAAWAQSQKGQARSKRLLATCHHALGHARFARKSMAECLELSERYVSPYDLLLSFAAARRIDPHIVGDETELARLLRGSAREAEYGPPSTPMEGTSAL